MDYGSAMSTIVTTDPAPYQIFNDYDSDYLRYLLNVNKTKMSIALRVFEDAVQDHRCMKRMNVISSKKSRGASLYCLRLRMASVETFIHLLNRYMLVLQRDNLKLQSQLRGYLPMQVYNIYWRSQAHVLSNPPNVHGHFVWADNFRQSDTQSRTRSRIMHARWRQLTSGGSSQAQLTSGGSSQAQLTSGGSSQAQLTSGGSSQAQNTTSLPSLKYPAADSKNSRSPSNPEVGSQNPLSAAMSLPTTNSSTSAASPTGAANPFILVIPESCHVKPSSANSSALSPDENTGKLVSDMCYLTLEPAICNTRPSWVNAEEMEVPTLRTHSAVSPGNPVESTETRDFEDAEYIFPTTQDPAEPSAGS